MQADNDIRKTPANKLARYQKGSALVEFAFILPIFLLLLFGIVFYTVALYNKTVLTMATREGARAGTLYSPDRTDENAPTTAENRAYMVCTDRLVALGPGMTYSTDADPVAGGILTVHATMHYPGFIHIPGFLNSTEFFLSDLELSAQTSMKLE